MDNHEIHEKRKQSTRHDPVGLKDLPFVSFVHFVVKD